MSKAAIFLAEGFETIEALMVVDLCRRASIDITTVSITEDLPVKSSQGITVVADSRLSDIDFAGLDMIILPGGMPGTTNLEACAPLMEQLDAFHAAGRNISAICAAPGIFGRRGYLSGKKATCFPGVEPHLAGADATGGKVEAADHIITGRAMGTAMEFGLAIIERLEGKAKADAIAAQVTFEG